jgi:two-component sensor histidine kinase
MLDLDTSTALGLITVELLANSFLHAFPKDVGSITVSLTVSEAGDRGKIIFADDGVGFVEPAESERRGVFLVRRLARQVDGTAEVRSDHGTTWTLDFPVASSRASTTAIAKESATASFGMDR